MKLEIETVKTDEETRMEKLFKKLVGKISFIQSRAEQEQLVSKFAEEIFGKISQDKKKKIVDEVLSYGILEEFMNDADVEDIMVNALKPAFTFSSKKGVARSNKKFSSLEELNLFIKKLLVFSGREKLEELNDFHLPNGCRANVASSPMGPQITIRKFRHEPLSLIDLIESGMLNYSLGAQLWLYADGLRLKPANILIAGTPGSGKTTLLNALFAFMPPNERVVVIEDTLELNTETNENCARLEASESVSMAGLVKNSLRMRPSRIIVGEVRGAEASDLMTAMNIGKICMGTLHASSSRDAVTRLENAPMNVPTEIIPLIDVFIVLKQF
ncbi:CpaF family protein, partial [Candidatus Micrarchaeota archaeon]|nr:CpaF family protein [Candidatus Micrarchaeota archaeon]